MKYEILLADDDDSIRLVLSKALTRAGHSVRSTDNADTLLKWAQAGGGDIIITDVMMGGHEVFSALPEIMSARPNMPIIVISANNTVNTALKSGQHRVFEYIPKPFDLAHVTKAVMRAGQSTRPKRSGINPELGKLPMIGRSKAMQPVFRAVSRFAPSDLPVLIKGAVGTGKDLVARLLHDGGARKDRPFLRINDFSNLSLCLQKVNGGDIYIDEVSEISSLQQEALLALMSECETIAPSNRPRILSATRKDLKKLSEQGRFRDDLLYRINVAEITLPKLSSREKDVHELAEVFLHQASGANKRRFETAALDVFLRHEWVGNVRELENLVQRLAVLYSDDLITADMVLGELSNLAAMEGTEQHTPKSLENPLSEQCRRLLIQFQNANAHDSGAPEKAISPYDAALSWVEKPLIIEALKLTGGNKAKAAQLLGIHRNTLRTKLNAYNIK